jgi:hypothetical protein
VEDGVHIFKFAFSAACRNTVVRLCHVAEIPLAGIGLLDFRL